MFLSQEDSNLDIDAARARKNEKHTKKQKAKGSKKRRVKKPKVKKEHAK